MDRPKLWQVGDVVQLNTYSDYWDEEKDKPYQGEIPHGEESIVTFIGIRGKARCAHYVDMVRKISLSYQTGEVVPYE